jgi:hypothetical protein
MTQVHGGDSPFLGFLLALAAKPVLLASGIGAIPEPARPVSGDRLGAVEGTGSGNVAQAIASDAVTVLRTLMALSGFAPLLQPIMEQAVRWGGQHSKRVTRKGCRLPCVWL